MAFGIKKIGQFLDTSALTGNHSVVGIDIGTSSVKVVGLTEGKNGAELETYGELQLGPYAGLEIGRTVNLDAGKLGLALTDILREANVTARNAALAIPNSASFIAAVEFPTRDQAKLASMVPIEARKYIPVPINEVTLDWFMIPPRAQVAEAAPVQTPESTHVLLAAIFNEALHKYRSAVQHAGVAVGLNEMESFSVIRSSIHEDDETVMIMDLGASSAKMYIVANGILHESHRIPIGGQDLTMAIVETMKLSHGEAEEAKRQMGFVAGDGYDPRLVEALTRPIERIINETRRVIARYESEGPEKINKIFLTGGGSSLKGITESFTTAFSIPVVRANPFSKVAYPAFLEETLKEAGPSFAVAIGIALRRLIEK